MNKVFQAIEMAARAHRGQLRKGSGVPYLIHPLNVAKLLIEQGCEEELVVAGILHDTVEDTDVELVDIAAAFGSRVSGLVAGASEPDKTATWEVRKQHTIDSLAQLPTEALWIICADKLDNARSLREDLARTGPDLWSNFSRGQAKQAWYYRSVVVELQKRIKGGLLTRLQGEVEALFAGG